MDASETIRAIWITVAITQGCYIGAWVLYAVLGKIFGKRDEDEDDGW